MVWTHRVPASLVVIEQAQVIERFQFESNGVGTSRVLSCLAQGRIRTISQALTPTATRIALLYLEY